MPVRDLRKSILKYAMEGKLVKQDPNDEPASVLLDKIKQEKEKLIKEGKIRKDKRDSAIYKGEDGHYYEKIGNKTTDINDKIPFEIPNSWSYVRFEHVVRFNLGATPNRKAKKYWSNGTIPWISISDMEENGHINRTKECVTEDAIRDKFSSKLCNPGTLIMSFKLTIGKTSIVDMKSCHNEAIISIYPYYDCNNIIRDYLFKFLPLLTEYVKKRGAIKGDTLNSKIMADMFIPIPPLEEQKRIVDKLIELEPLFDEYENLVVDDENLDSDFQKKLRKSILKYAMEGKLVKQDPNDEPASVLLDKIKQEKEKLIKEGKIRKDKRDSAIYKGEDGHYYEKIGNKTTDITEEIPFEIPNSWEFAKVESLCCIIPTKMYQINEKEIKKEGSIPVVSQGQTLIEGYTDNETKKIKVDTPIIIFGDHTKNVKYIDFDFVVGADGTKLLDPILVNEKWFYYLIQWASNLLRDRGYARHYVLLKNSLLPVPPLEEQKRIADKLDQIFEIL